MDLYKLHEEYLLSPAQLSCTIRKLIEIDAVELNGLLARLTDCGRKWIFAERRRIFLSDRQRYWAYSVGAEPAARMPVYNPYLPKLKNMDIRFLAKK